MTHSGTFCFLLLMSSVILGGGSMLLFGVFLFVGSFQFFDLGFSSPADLGWDGAILSMVFFVQHSFMVRPPVHEWLARYIPRNFLPAFYSVASGLALFFVLLLWQRALPDLLVVPPPWRWFLRFLFIAALAFAAWAALALDRLDALGTKPLLSDLELTSPLKDQPLTTHGPYGIVRHPMYTATLLLIWTCPDLSGDRLLFNVLWTTWIVVASKLEEGELLERYGKAYRNYMDHVPSLLPWPRHSGRTS